MPKGLQISITDDDRFYMEMASCIAHENAGHGGAPCGAVVVRNGEVIAAAAHSVTQDHDSTAHAPVKAIRKACDMVGGTRIEGCIVYCSSEPCHMCMSALSRAGVSRVYYANAVAGAVVDDSDYTVIDVTVAAESFYKCCARKGDDKH